MFSVMKDCPKCKHNKKYPESSLCAYHGTPKAGPGRTCGISGTADTHEYHLEFIVKKCIEQRGFTEIIDDDPFVDPFPEHPLGYFIVQNKWTRALAKPTISRTISWDGHSDGSNKASA